jgi:hypothetical protein
MKQDNRASGDGKVRLDYADFLARKTPTVAPDGFDAVIEGNHLWPWQRDCVAWACKLGRAALFEDTGLGKTRQQLEWARQVHAHTGGRVLILAPLAVGAQTVEEAKSIGLGELIAQVQTPDESDCPLLVTNYDRARSFPPGLFAGVVLDESSILKSYMGAMKRYLLEAFAETPYRLACTATPAPNDYLELGNHAQFLGVMTSHQMIARWFISDQKEAGSYRLKGHAVGPFWDWVTSWARCIGRPSDIGDFSDEGYVLPELRVRLQPVQVDIVDQTRTELFRSPSLSATGLHKERRRTCQARADRVRELLERWPGEPCVVWCETNYDADAVMERLPDAVEVAGAMSPKMKRDRLLGFSRGDFPVLVTKPKIAGFGMNWQHCARTVFNGPSYSYEMLYQAIRRFWRFGQRRPVEAEIVLAATEQSVWATLERKRHDHEAMKVQMFRAARRSQQRKAAVVGYHAVHSSPVPAWLTTKED